MGRERRGAPALQALRLCAPRPRSRRSPPGATRRSEAAAAQRGAGTTAVTRLQRARAGAGVGLVVGVGTFAADLLGTFAAVGWLFDPTLAGAALLLVGVLVAAGLGALLGAVLASFVHLPRPPRAITATVSI